MFFLLYQPFSVTSLHFTSLLAPYPGGGVGGSDPSSLNVSVVCIFWHHPQFSHVPVHKIAPSPSGILWTVTLHLYNDCLPFPPIPDLRAQATPSLNQVLKIYSGKVVLHFIWLYISNFSFTKKKNSF